MFCLLWQDFPALYRLAFNSLDSFFFIYTSVSTLLMNPEYFKFITKICGLMWWRKKIPKYVLLYFILRGAILNPPLQKNMGVAPHFC